MKTLSVIIVNYNVKELLLQCLTSLKEALIDVDAEIIVLDNGSTDGSKAFFENRKDSDPFFSTIQFVFLQENLGFAKSNNRGIDISKGAFILLLNPDTIVQKETIQKCITHFKEHPHTGALGVRMTDGSGKYLKESKRGYPSLLTTFFKSMGLSLLFSHSKLFAKYHLGHIDEFANAPVEILSGAFMMIRADILREIKGLDERFFMYGEDIDLSIRIKNAGWELFYIGEAAITHFKGGSTAIGSFEHIRHFYHAMILFVEKYYSTGFKKILKPILVCSIYLRALISFAAYSILKIIKARASSSSEFRKG